MKKVSLYLFLIAILSACDDGDIIVTSFDFSEATLQSCEGSNGFVFYSINDEAQESIAINLGITSDFFLEAGATEFQIGSTTNVVDYRVFNEPVTSSYFCNSIPPISPTTTINYTSISGIAILTNTTVLDDNDGLIEADQTIDTDNDGIFDYYDFDDDGDNVLTILEVGVDPENPTDTDGDGIPNYLDIDDDNDGVLTINEDLDMDLDPTNDITDGIPNYLNPDATKSAVVKSYREHTYFINTSTSLFIQDLVFTGEGEEITQESLDLGSILDIFTGEIVITPAF